MGSTARFQQYWAVSCDYVDPTFLVHIHAQLAATWLEKWGSIYSFGVHSRSESGLILPFEYVKRSVELVSNTYEPNGDEEITTGSSGKEATKKFCKNIFSLIPCKWNTSVAHVCLFLLYIFVKMKNFNRNLTKSQWFRFIVNKNR